MKPRRFVIEGTWNGRDVHRTVHAGSRKKLRAWAEATHGIVFGDGTTLYLSVRDCTPRERVQEIKGYRDLIEDCAWRGVSSVAELQRAQSAARGGA